LIVRLRLRPNLGPAGALGNDECPGAPVLVPVRQDLRRDPRIDGVVLARRIGDQPLQFRAAAFVAQRKEPQEDNRQNIPLVVGGLDGSPQVDCGLPELGGQGGYTVPVRLGSGLGLLHLCSFRHGLRS